MKTDVIEDTWRGHDPDEALACATRWTDSMPSRIQYHDDDCFELTDGLMCHENPDGFFNPCGDSDLDENAQFLYIAPLSTLGREPMRNMPTGLHRRASPPQ